MRDYTPTRFSPHEIDREGAARALDQAHDLGIDLGLPGVADLVALLGAAAQGVLPALWRVSHRVGALARERVMHGVVAPATLPPAPGVPRVGEAPPEVAAVKRTLRQMRDEALVRTALRELDAAVDVDGTAREWSHVAAMTTEHALAAAAAMVEARNGPPLDARGARCGLTVLGMGKLGGEELNLGSDIDICLFYATDDGAAGTRTLNQHFGRVGTTLADLLGDVTADGFAFRVDLRLRPEGSRGPVANALASAERYYETWGRTWERAALLRARPIAGDLALGRSLLDALRPFVFRRAVDPTVAGELVAMLERARREQLRDPERDLKLGRGGIREVEFFVQALQLVWGGRHPALQVAGTLSALARLHSLGLLSHRELRDLDEAWGLLRRVEHRIQAMQPFATHTLPTDAQRLGVLARSLGYADDAALLGALDEARARVRALWDTLTPGPAAPGEGRAPDDAASSPEAPSVFLQLAEAVSSGLDAPALSLRAVDALGVRDGDAAAADLARLARRADQPLSPTAFAAAPTVAERLLAEVRDAPDPDMALGHLADLFERLRPAQVYAARLVAQPSLARGLVGLIGASEHLARTLLARPELLDTVVGGGGAPDLDELAPWVETAVSLAGRSAPGDTEEALGAMRKVMREASFSVGVADLAGVLEPEGVMARLSRLAECIVQQCLGLAAAECAARYGDPGADGPLSGIVVVALGSLAACELSHGGDLDLLFVYVGDGTTRGGRRGEVTRGEYAVRLAQRTLSFLSAPHAEGPGYATDTRLRPSGSQGTLVSSLEAFQRYHEAQSASWERQSLLRARVVAGDPVAGAVVQAAVDGVAYGRGGPDLAELKRLRARMELELGREDRGQLALKYGRGALVDVEFAAQAMQMTYGRDPRVRTPNTHAALVALRDAGHLPEELAAALLVGERTLRATLLAARLTTLRGTLVPSSPSAVTVARRMGYRDRGERTALEGLLADLARTRDAVRRAWRDTLTLLTARAEAAP